MNTTSIRQMGCRSAAVWVALLLCLSGPACFRTPDTSKILCVVLSNCPNGYYCAKNQEANQGICAPGPAPADGNIADLSESPAPDGKGDAPADGSLGRDTNTVIDANLGGAGGATGDAPSGGAGAGGGSVTSDGSSATGDTAATPDALLGNDATDVPATLANGSVCMVDGQCSSSACVDGHCCDGKCDGNCESCVTGTCSFTSTPRKDCAGTGKCAGICDKSHTKACTYPDSTMVCAAQSCSAGQLTNKSLCDGLGNCPVQTPTTCDSSQCLVDNSDCSGTCSTASCGTAKYCTGSTCAPLKNQGDACADKAECSTGNCVDGYCCESTCTGTCTTCAATHGKCTNTTSPRTGKSCSGTAPCNAACNGSSPDCVPASTTTQCGSASCLSSTQLQLVGTCNSQGTCSQSTQTCTVCLSSTNACGECTPTAKQCSTTGVPQHCDSTGHWVNDTGCDACQSCSGGVCQAVAAGTACTGGVCNSAGSCTLCTQGASCTTGIGECQTGSVDCSTGAVVCKASNKSSGTSCGNGPTCSSATLYPHQVCDGGGQCHTPNGTPCASGLCNGTSACQDCTSSTAPSSIQVVGTTPICASTSQNAGAVTLNRVGGSLGLGARWVWYKGALPATAGSGVATGDSIPNLQLASTTTYYVRAEGTCNVSNAATVTVPVYTAPQITVTPIAQSTDCTVAYGGWTTVSGSLSSLSAPATTIQWYYTTAGTTAKVVCDGNNFKNTTTLNLSVSPYINQTDWIEVIDVCGVEGWGSGTITVPDMSVCFP